MLPLFQWVGVQVKRLTTTWVVRNRLISVPSSRDTGRLSTKLPWFVLLLMIIQDWITSKENDLVCITEAWMSELGWV